MCVSNQSCFNVSRSSEMKGIVKERKKGRSFDSKTQGAKKHRSRLVPNGIRRTDIKRNGKDKTRQSNRRGRELTFGLRARKDVVHLVGGVDPVYQSIRLAYCRFPFSLNSRK